jgi:Leucine-rich repeat (LRR) protein
MNVHARQKHFGLNRQTRENEPHEMKSLHFAFLVQGPPGLVSRMHNIMWVWILGSWLISMGSITRSVEAVVPTCAGNISASEFEALYNFYMDSNGPTWSWEDNDIDWVFPSELWEPCTEQWDGLICAPSSVFGSSSSQSPCTIVGLDLGPHNISGTISSSIGSLTSLATIDLTNNQITGTIPEVMGQLSLLQLIDLSYNSLFGYIPTTFSIKNNETRAQFPEVSLGKMFVLTNLILQGNWLSGPIQSTLITCSKMTVLNLDLNRLTGPVPTNINLLGELEVLIISDNLLTHTIPSSIGLLSLAALGLYNNSLTQGIPESLGNLTQMTAFGLYENYLTGSVPSVFCEMKLMQYYNLASNFLNGSIPECLFGYEMLIGIDFSYNLMTGRIPGPVVVNGSVVQLVNALQLWFDYNTLTGPLPTFLCEVTPNLQELYLYDNLLSGSIPSTIGESMGLTLLDLASNALTGTLPSTLQQLTKLQLLNVSSNQLSGLLSSLLGSASSSTGYNYNATISQSLMYLDVSNNRFTGKIPDGLFSSNFVNLSEISSSEQSTTTPIPLTVVDLSINCFHGSIPISLCQATNLGAVLMNGLGASCPASWLENIKFLHGDVSNRFMQGGIPDCLWNMTSLKTVELAGNGLFGKLGELPSYSILRDVSLDSNYIIGTLPRSWQKYGQFSQLRLGSNMLMGNLDSGFQWSAE